MDALPVVVKHTRHHKDLYNLTMATINHQSKLCIHNLWLQLKKHELATRYVKKVDSKFMRKAIRTASDK